MRMNPEFQRQLWIHWRPALLGWSLGLCALILALPWALSDTPQPLLPNIGLTALLGLWGATVVYGSVLAARSLGEEASDNTWDGQRLCALTPWQMAWGKLLGATTPAWLYAAWFALAALFISTTWEVVVGPQRSGHLVALAVLWGLGLQAWAMNFVLVGWGAQPTASLGRRRSVWWLGAGVTFLLLPSMMGWGQAVLRTEHLQWWGWATSGLHLGYLGGALCLLLGLLTLWRQLCLHLDVATLPWAWPLGIAALALFSSGLSAQPEAQLAPQLVGMALVATGYIAIQHMSAHPRAWRQVQWSLQQGHWRTAAQALPLWPVSWLLALLASGVLAAGPQKAMLLALCLWVLRDSLMLTGFALLHGRLKSPLAVWVVVWLVLSAILPLIAWGLGMTALAQLLQPLPALLLEKAWFAPRTPALSPALAWAALGGQLLLAALWVVYAARQRQRAVNTS